MGSDAGRKTLLERTPLGGRFKKCAPNVGRMFPFSPRKTVEKEEKNRKGDQTKTKSSDFYKQFIWKDLQGIKTGGTSRARTCDPVIMSSQIASSDYAHFYHKNRKCGTNV